jgi:hypothetical protein
MSYQFPLAIHRLSRRGRDAREVQGESSGESSLFTIEEARQDGNPSKTSRESGMLEELIGECVVVDLRGEFVCLGTLLRIDEQFLELRNADLHDLRDTDTTRENYVAASLATGIKRNRRRLLLVRDEIVAIARLADVVES